MISGTHCREEVQGKFLEKMEMCLSCELFKANMDIAAMEETIKVTDTQFKEFRQIVADRDTELEGMSMQLAIGLSEAFEALKKVSLGDPSVRVDETSEVELISKLKHIINLTAKEIGEIVDQSHEFAIGLAEHFDVLNRVSKGDLEARVTGVSQVELLESLKKVINKTIGSISGEITERKRAEEKIQKQLKRISALREIDMAITASLDIRVTFNVFLEQLLDKLNVDAASILIIDPKTPILRYVASRGFRTTALHHTKLRLGKGHAGRAALERRIIDIPDLHEDPNDFVRSPLLAEESFISYYAAPLIAKGHVKGVLELFHRSRIESDQEWLDFLDALASQAAIAIDNAGLFDELQRSNIELVLAYDETLEGWSKALDMRDTGTEGHTQRVTDMTLRLAREMGVKEDELVHVRRGALLHDIGKMGIPDNILLKPGPLNDEEWEIMRKHPVYAYEMLLPISYLRSALDIPYCHHEKWDGTGYPRGLKEKYIPLAARIFAVVDVWDALNSERPYRPAWPEEKVKEYIREKAGKHFEPRIVDVFLKMEL